MPNNPDTPAGRAELRVKLRNLKRPVKLDYDFIEATADDLIELIETYVAEAERLARIDELKNLKDKDLPSYTSRADIIAYCESRIEAIEKESK